MVPAVDDELAKKLAFDDLAELRRVMSERYQREYDALSRVRLKRELLDALAEQVNFEAPQGMVDQEFEQIWQRLEAERKEGRLDEDDKDKDEETLRADYRAIAERRVKLGLLLAEIGRVNGITVAPEEMTRAKRAEAARYPGQEAQMMEFFRKYPAGRGRPARADLRGQGRRFRAGAGEGDRPDGHPGGTGAGAAGARACAAPDQRPPRPAPTRLRRREAATEAEATPAEA